MAKYTQPPFDSRILNIPFLIGGSAKLARGRLLRADDPSLRLDFLYNPPTVAVSHGANNSIPDTTQRSKAEYDAFNFVAPMNQSLSWSLLFDRTYDTWDGSLNGKPQFEYGVYCDVLALYEMCGILSLNNIESAGPGFSDAELNELRPLLGAGLNAPHPTGPLIPYPMRVYFGGPLRYYGSLSSIDITYTHFTQDMVPNRCVVSFSMSILADTSTADQVAIQLGQAVSLTNLTSPPPTTAPLNPTPAIPVTP